MQIAWAISVTCTCKGNCKSGILNLCCDTGQHAQGSMWILKAMQWYLFQGYIRALIRHETFTHAVCCMFQARISDCILLNGRSAHQQCMISVQVGEYSAERLRNQSGKWATRKNFPCSQMLSENYLRMVRLLNTLMFLCVGSCYAPSRGAVKAPHRRGRAEKSKLFELYLSSYKPT